MSEERPNPAVGLITGGSRALTAQLFSFYMRVPVKLFRPSRFDYIDLLRHSLNEKATDAYSFWRHSRPALLYRAICQHGWRFIPDKLLPPIVANSLAGSVLYTTYLSTIYVQQHALARSSDAKVNTTAPTFRQALVAGWLAGAAQAAVATPLDAIAIRFDADVMTSKTTLWNYGKDLLRTIGPRAAYGGLTLNLIKESSTFAVFFSTYEFVKGPVYRRYSAWWYRPGYFHPQGRKKSKVMYPSFVLVGGCIAAAAMQLISYPLTKIQKLHTIRLQAIDQQARGSRTGGWRIYFKSYAKTFRAAQAQVTRVSHGSWLNWLYGGVGKYTLWSMPSSSIGLLIFEIMRIRYGGKNPDAEFGGGAEPLEA